MAVITTFLVPKSVSPMIDVGSFWITRPVPLPATGIANTDNVQVVEISAPCRLFDTFTVVPSTLGAACTVKLQLNRANVRTDLSVASTAAGASFPRMNVAPQNLLAGDIIELLVAGAGVTTAATVTVDLELQRA